MSVFSILSPLPFQLLRHVRQLTTIVHNENGTSLKNLSQASPCAGILG